MRKGWLPFSLLVLVLLVTAWMHRKSFGQPVEFSILQVTNRYFLVGTLQNFRDIQKLKELFSGQGVTLDTESAHTNTLLESRGVLELVEKLVVPFVSLYHQGKMVYQDGILLLEGSVESEEEKRLMQQRLKRSSVPVENRTKVVKPAAIDFTIMQRKGTLYTIEGNFSTLMQADELATLIDAEKCQAKIILEIIDSDRSNKNNIIEKLTPLISFFLSHVSKGKIVYRNRKLTISGKVIHQKEIEQIDLLLKELNVESENTVLLNIQKIKGLKAKEKAKKLIKTLQYKRAKIAEVKKAEEEVSKDIVAMMDAEQNKQKSIIDNSRARKNLRTLFETETITFNTAQTTLTPLGLGTVSKIAVILKAYPNVKIEVAGHTDSDGDDAFNMLLSQGRVNNVKRALIKEGVAKERIEAIGYGETKPLFPNTTRENKQKNRRVEIIVKGE